MKKGDRSAEALGPVGTAHSDSEWQRKGATLSDKTARKEFGLTQEEILRAIRVGALQYRQNSIFGNPFLRLLRREVEALVASKRGRAYVQQRRATAEVARTNRELKRLKALVIALERRRSELLRDAQPGAPRRPRN
jgi:transcriptional regulator with XRE-family HTH domain